MAKDLWLFGITGDWNTAALDPGAWYSTVRDGSCRFMAAWVKEEERASEHRQREREAEEVDKVEVEPGVAMISLRRFRATLIGPTQGLPKRRRLCLCVWVHGCDPGKLSGSSRLALYQTLSIECSSPILFSGMCSALLFLYFCRPRILLCLLCFHSLVEALKCSDIFPVQETTYRIGNHVYYWVWLRPDRLM